MFNRFLSAGLAGLLSVTLVMPICGQDDAAKSDAAKSDSAESDAAAKDKVVRPFAEVSAAWDKLNKGLDELIDKYPTATPDEQKELVKEYEAAVKASRELLPELRAAAITAYTAAPNADEKVTKTLVGLLANDVRLDQYTDALELGKLLLKNDCEEPIVDGLVGSAAYCLDDFETAAIHLNKAKAKNALTQQSTSYLEDLEEATKAWTREQELRKAETTADDLPRVKLQTSKGDLVIELMENEAPQAVANFVSLVDKEFYNGLTFHRVLPGFMAQAGCPQGTGTGGPGYKIHCECQQENHRAHFRGTLSMAHAGRDTGGSQFFLTFRRTSHLDGRHTVFGRVIEGMDVLAKLQRRDPTRRGQPEPDTIVKAEVLRKRDHEYVPTKVAE